MTENVEQRARAQCHADLVASGVPESEIARAVDRYWVVVAAESSSGIGLLDDDVPPADLDILRREFLYLIGRRDRYSR